MSLHRGAACIDCHRRKVRCDGATPACGRCVAGGHAEDCEYTCGESQSRVKTRVKTLEDNIARLEAKIACLERKKARATLSQPLQDIQIPGRGGAQYSPTRTGFHPALPELPYPSLPQDWTERPILPLEIARILVDIFAPHAFNHGFFLHGPRFLVKMFPSDGSPSSLPLSLISVVYLWGIHLSSHQPWIAHEETFLNRAFVQLLKSQHPNQIVANIQAEVLLSNYLLRSGNFSSAMHRLNSALSQSVACGLHRPGSRSTGANFVLPPPSDGLELGERIDAFWTIVLFHKSWVAALQWPSRISTVLDDMIYVPFPLDMSAYESGKLTFNDLSSPTLKQFLDDPQDEGVVSTLALSVQSAYMFERACYIGVEWKSVLGITEEAIQFLVFDSRLSDFIRTLPTIETYPERFRHAWIATNSIVQAAVIQLHGSVDTSESQSRCLQAAEKIVSMIQTIPPELEHVNPILGTMWFIASRALISALHRLGKAEVTEDTVLHTANIKLSLKTLLETMTTYSIKCALIYSRLGHTQELCRQHGIQLA
ncbi:hypothetical protein D9758_002019 [Tetrapyrgos nigripes]|uniref:Zn(2)-C6 fungal-type domain-containing protein n=1 Tax=Tetrapyrgos nigripes TaxID=182062 RepID=A0A8H5LVJ5_9AGAR|nr:hypothetical protein D9758_002019 [Tetrapyrgos nigripes]